MKTIMRKLHAWDPVMVIAGKHKGKISTIEKFVEKEAFASWKKITQLYVFVKWVNEVKKAVKWQWFMTKTLPLHISNVMYYSEKGKAAAKVRIVTDKKSGKKHRELKKLEEKITK